MTDENDIQIESEEAPESQAYEKMVGKLEALKEELKQCKKERQEYLDGWQRLRADVANSKREQSATMGRIETAIREEVIVDIIPILDSFDMAMWGEKWGAVDEVWRRGIEQIRAQCVSVLEKHGITAYGEVGEPFDPLMHESIQEEEAEAPSHTIVRVLHKGYRSNDRLIRPAQVVISK